MSTTMPGNELKKTVVPRMTTLSERTHIPWPSMDLSINVRSITIRSAPGDVIILFP